MKKPLAPLLVLFLFIAFLFGCKKETESLRTPSLSDFFPLQTGRSYLYRLDSTMPASFGAYLTVKSYEAKDSIESTFTDNEGRLSYRIFRFTRDTLEIQPWTFAATYVATPTQQSTEYVDNNLRFIKLHQPISEGFSWPAHTYINTSLDNLRYLDGWKYEYQDLGQPYTVFDKTFDSTITVFQKDETTPEVFNRDTYNEKSYGKEVYAKGIGLIYKEFLHWTWNVSSLGSGYEDGSYGIKLQLIGHN